MSSPIDVQRLREEILSWMSPPSADKHGRVAGRQIRRLVGALEQSHAREDLFLSTVAEAVLARRLLESGCAIDIERPTAGGRHADFHVKSEGTEFWLHVKRIGALAETEAAAPLPLPLAQLQAINRPIAVAVRWAPSTDSTGMRILYEALEPFVQQASVGDELVVRAEGGAWVGAARIVTPTSGGNVVIRTGVDAGWEAAIPRVQRLLRKAYSQFMPGATNVICMASDHAAACESIETALLGSIIERWDKFPPRGHRVAHGRADDGFWSRGQFEMSSLVIWFPIDGSESPKIWQRPPHGTVHANDQLVSSVLRRVMGVEQQH